VTEIQQDNSVALSVDVSDQAQIPASPYWRMLVLDHYDNGTFKLSSSLIMQEFGKDRTAGFLHGEAKSKKGPAVVWTFYLESGVSRYLPILGPFEILRFREHQNFRYASQLAVVRLRDDPVTMTAYRVEGFEQGTLLPDREFAQRWRTRPAVAQRGTTLQHRLGIQLDTDVAALNRAVEEVSGGAQLSARAFARAAGDWLKKNHSYSLSPSIPRGEGDPLVRWMGGGGPGHCELFAGSFVLVARAAGFPARMVTGFRGGSWNGYSNNFTIRNADAHAWAEIFDEEAGGWLRTDPLAPSETTQAQEIPGEAAMASRLDRSWKARLDSLRVFWYRRIVSFDQRSQVETLKAVKEATENSGRRLREMLTTSLAELKEWLKSPWNFRRVAQLAAGVAGLVALMWLWREFGRTWWRMLTRKRGVTREDPIRREAGRWLRKTEKLAAGRADRVQIVSELQRLRFGARSSWPAPEKVFRQARRLVREARRSERLTRS
jgi:transglutaminase-like putative cysteine protease